VYKIKLFLVAFVFTLAGSVSADHLNEHTVEQRIKPSGSVYLEGDDVPVSKSAVVVSTGPRSAEEIYNTKCSTCHATDAIGAPMFGNAASWVERITKGEEMLINNAMNGINAMPPKGTCGDCSADEIKQTVLYMVANSQ
jgi:cytochrome c5